MTPPRSPPRTEDGYLEGYPETQPSIAWPLLPHWRLVRSGPDWRLVRPGRARRAPHGLSATGAKEELGRLFASVPRLGDPVARVSFLTLARPTPKAMARI